MRFLNHLFGKIGLLPEHMTDKQIMLAKQGEQDVDLTAHPDLHHAQQAQLYWDAGRLSEAHAQFTLAIHHASEDAVLWLNRGNLLFQMGRFHEALADFDRASKLADLPAEMLANARMIRTLGPDNPTLARLAKRRSQQ